MVQPLVTVFALALSAQQFDTSTYANRATEALVARARQRHAVQDTLVHDYTALVRTRIDAGIGRRRFAVIPPFVAFESAARITWARPNDLKIQLLGTRTASTLRGVRASGAFDDPWFIPRGLGDTIRFVDDEIPETGALHPLAQDGPRFYRYRIVDSITIALPERQVRAVGVRVEPRALGPSLVAGNMWIESETAEVVRMTIVFLGEFLWSTPESTSVEDSAQARRDTRRANRILKVEAELEYGLHAARYWMPYRQLVTLTADIPWFINARVPVRFLSTFSEYRVNTGAVPAFTVAPADSGEFWSRCRRRGAADSTCPAGFRRRRERVATGYARSERWAGGRWEIDVPPRDSLLSYPWPDQLSLAPDPAAEAIIRETSATLARISQQLPAEWVGRQTVGVAFERFSDLVRFNRVQGASLGAGIQLHPGPLYLSALATGRFGLTDRRPTGSLVLRRDAPGGRFDAGVWRQVAEAEPWTEGLGAGNSLNALLAGHDDADYHLALGGGMSFTGNHGAWRDMTVSAAFERHRPMAAVARSTLNDLLGGSGTYQPNPAAAAGDFVRVSLQRPLGAGFTRWTLGADAVAGDAGRAGRAWAVLRIPFVVAQRSGALTVRSGGTVGDSLAQFVFRVGGPRTVRGYTYGTRVGAGIWAAQLDLALSRGSILAPVAFVDAGDVFGSGDPLVSAGAGFSVLNGLVRFNVAKGLNPPVPARFDLLFRAPR